MKTLFVLIWYSSGLCNNNGVMGPCAHEEVFQSEAEAISYAKEKVAATDIYGDTWNKSEVFELWRVSGSSVALNVSRTVSAEKKP